MSMNHIIYPNDYHEALRDIKNWTEFGLDTETNSLNPFMADILLIQVGNERTQYVFDVYKLKKVGINFSELKEILEDEKYLKIGHNLEFDYKMFKHILGITLENIFDTMIAEQLLTKGRKLQGFGLDAVLEKYALVYEMDKTVRKEFADLPFGTDITADQIQYAALDVVYMIPLKNKLMELLVRDDMVELMEVENATVLVIGDLYLNGVYLDAKQWKELEISEDPNKETATTIRDRAKKKLLEFLPDNFDPMSIQPEGKKSKIQSTGQLGLVLDIEKASININFNSPIQVKGFLTVTTGKEPPDTNEKTLYKFYRKSDGTLPPVVKALLNYREFEKLITTYGGAFYDEHVNPFTGRIHSSYRQLKPDNGRLSSDSPNLQNIPRLKQYRACFKPQKPGYKFVCADYSQFELRVIAELSGEESWIEVLNDPKRDLHTFVCSAIYGVEEKSIGKKDPLRQVGKTLNFGISYGAGYNKIMDTTNKAYMEEGIDREMTKQDAKFAVNGYKTNFPEVNKTLEYWADFAIAHDYAFSPRDKRRRYITNIDKDNMKEVSGARNMAKNMVCSACNATVTKQAMANIRKRIQENNYDAKLVITVHDEVEVEVIDSQAEEVARMVKEEMINAGKKYLTKVPVDVEVSVESCWVK